MLTDRQWATLLAALWFWREEMSQQHLEVQRPYFECQELARFVPLSADEVVALARVLRAQLGGSGPS